MTKLRRSYVGSADCISYLGGRSEIRDVELHDDALLDQVGTCNGLYITMKV